jgi:hypothetical protein
MQNDQVGYKDLPQGQGVDVIGRSNHLSTKRQRRKIFGFTIKVLDFSRHSAS